jgi:hypothetical protein
MAKATAQPGAISDAAPRDAAGGMRGQLVALAHAHDPIARFILAGRPTLFWRAVLGWLAITIVVDFVAGSQFGVLRGGGQRIGLFDDLAGLLQEFVVFPLLMGYFVWAPPALLRAMRDLDIEGVVDVQRSDIRWARDFMGTGLTVLLAVSAIVLGVVLYLAYTTSPLNGLLWLADPRFAAVKLPFWILQSWAATSLILSMVVLTGLLGRIFGADRKIAIEPLHPDGCGGLRPLSAFALKLTAFLGLAGATLLLVERNYIFSRGYANELFAVPVHVMAVVFGIGGIVFFFAPLMAPHRRMAAAKVEALHRVSDRFHTVEYRTITQLSTLKTEGFAAAARDLESMRKIYDLIDTFPVWPFDVRIFRYFAIAVVGQPVLALGWDIFGDKIKAFFGVG